jgi:hypothetical protein
LSLSFIVGAFGDGDRRGSMQRILCFTAVLTLACSEQLPGTCTVAIAGEGFGILAADCNEARGDGSTGSAPCKIRTGNGLAVTLAGLILDGNTGLDLMELAAAAMAEFDSPQKAADRFAVRAVEELARSLERQRAEASQMWHSRLGVVLARAVFAGSERGQVAVVVRTIEVSSEGLVRDLGSRVIVSGAFPHVVVFCARAEELMRSDSSWKTLEPGRLAFELIRASAAIPNAVRPESAASVIRIGMNGVTWLNRGACSEISPPEGSNRVRPGPPTRTSLVPQSGR